MTDNKQKLIHLVSALEEESIIDYCYTFIGLKVYGAAKLPESITEDLRRLQDKENREMTEEEKQAGECRIDTVRMLFDIQKLEPLNYIRIIVEDILKEQREAVTA